MKYSTPKMAAIVLVFATLGLQQSCATKVKHIAVDPEFSAVSLQKEGVAILGYGSVVEGELKSRSQSEQQCSQLRFALLEQQEGIKLASRGETRQILGDALAARCDVAVEKYGGLDAAILGELAGISALEPRFALVQRVENDRIEFDKKDITEQVDGKMKTTGKEYKSSRIMTATFKIYDLNSCKQVWEASIEGKGESKNQVSDSAAGDRIGGFVGDVIETVDAIDEILGDEESLPYPEPPSQASVLTLIYKKFAKLLLEGNG